MSLTTLALTWLCLAQSPAPNASDPVLLAKRSFPIPINIKEERRAEMRQLILFTSMDQGQNWSQVIAVNPTETSFPFKAPQDGLYWFSVAVVDQKGKQQPESPYTVPPALKVLVDTVNPVIRIASGERLGDEAVVGWEIQEERPDFGSLKLEYRAADSPSFGSWTAVPIANPGPTGQVRFRPTTASPVTVRMEIKDQVGNVGTAQRELAAGPTPVTGGAAPVTSPGTNAGLPTASQPPAPYPGPGASAQATVPSPVGRTDSFPNPDRSNYQATTLPPAYTQPASPPAAYPVPAYPPQTQGGGEIMRTIATSGTDPAPTGSDLVPVSRGSLPKAQLVNDPRISVDFTVTKVGASGVGKVELWITRDEGTTWRYLTDDPDAVGRDPGQKQHLLATLPGEGVFGLRLVTQSGAGLGRQEPRPGELPELRIEVDTTKPAVKLFEPAPDPQQLNTLVLRWSAQDRNLAAKAITLEYAEQREGPWVAIATSLPNTGSYNWQVPKTVPYQAYLRVSAVDMAGNTNTAQAKEPSLIDLNKPEIHAVGVSVRPQAPSAPPDAAPQPRERRRGFDMRN